MRIRVTERTSGKVKIDKRFTDTYAIDARKAEN